MLSLTREMIEAGEIDAMAARDAPAMQVLSDEERKSSLRDTLAAKPPEDLWLFAYGSLIWNPTVQFTETRKAQIKGWHRAFCLATPVGRGSIENPGLVLGLEEGGYCEGVAFRIAANDVEAELATLWKREMLSNAYVPKWLELLDESERGFGRGIAFTINPSSDRYTGKLSRDEVVRRLATASGALGSSADYLFQTCGGLEARGICDIELDSLRNEVMAIRKPESDGDQSTFFDPKGGKATIE